MNTMDNTQVIKAIEKFAFHRYLEQLVHADLRRVTLFPIFKQTSAPNLSEPAHLLMVDDLARIAGIGAGMTKN